MWENRSYPFFRVLNQEESGAGPHGALGLPLMPGRSLAVDPRYSCARNPDLGCRPGAEGHERQARRPADGGA